MRLGFTNARDRVVRIRHPRWPTLVSPQAHSRGAAGTLLSCRLCPSVFVSEGYLLRHIRDKHPDGVSQDGCGSARAATGSITPRTWLDTSDDARLWLRHEVLYIIFLTASFY